MDLYISTLLDSFKIESLRTNVYIEHKITKFLRLQFKCIIKAITGQKNFILASMIQKSKYSLAMFWFFDNQPEFLPWVESMGGDARTIRMRYTAPATEKDHTFSVIIYYIRIYEY